MAWMWPGKGLQYFAEEDGTEEVRRETEEAAEEELSDLALQAEILRQRLGELEQSLDLIGQALGLGERAGAERILAETSARKQRREKRSLERAVEAKRWLEELKRQERELREQIPDFDLDRELDDPMFLRLTAPHNGMSLEAAWFALHHRELAQKLAREGADWAVKSIQAGALRPRELGGGQGGYRQCVDARRMSREEREDLKRRIYQAKARGEKLRID